MPLNKITFNDGATFWHYRSKRRLEQIKAFQSRETAEQAFSPARCIERTLAEERKMYGPR